MKRRKQGSSALLEKYIQERERNQEEIARLTARNKELEPIIVEEENLEIVALVRSTQMGLAAFRHLMEGYQKNGVLFLMDKNTDTQEETTHEV